jgi:tetratricopeptide (TPR) repeat protein
MPESYATGKKQNAVKELGTWKKLAVAAVLLGAAVMGTIWLVQTNGKNSKVAVTTEKTDTPKNVRNPDTSSVPGSSPNDIVHSTKDKNTPGPDKESTTERHLPQNINSVRPESLSAAYLKPDALPQPNENPPFFDANESYSRGEYKAAITSLEEVVERLEDPDLKTRGEEDERSKYLFYAYYYKAQSHIGINNIEKAASDLREAIKYSPDNYWKSKVRWYLALTYLKEEQVQEAGALLKQVAQNKDAGEYKQKANNLLNTLKDTKK